MDSTMALISWSRCAMLASMSSTTASCSTVMPCPSSSPTSTRAAPRPWLRHEGARKQMAITREQAGSTCKVARGGGCTCAHRAQRERGGHPYL